MKIKLNLKSERIRRYNKSILKTFKKHNGFTEEINKIGLSLIDNKRMQSIDQIETNANRSIKAFVSEKKD